MPSSRSEPNSSPELLDDGVTGQEPKTVLLSPRLFGELKKASPQRMHHSELGHPLSEPKEEPTGNRRKGTSPRVVLGADGKQGLDICQYRQGRFGCPYRPAAAAFARVGHERDHDVRPADDHQ